MTQYSATWACIFVAVVSCCSSATAQDSSPADVFVETPTTVVFSWSRINGRIVRLQGATAKQIIDILSPQLPIVGVRHLPSHVRFNVDLSDSSAGEHALLSELGKKLGLEIAIRDTTSKFVIVRNHTIGVPTTWERSSVDTEGAIRQIDERDGMYLATQTSMTSLLQFITDHDDRPVLNQCALRERYNFSFTFSDRDGSALLESFGFDVKHKERTARAIVIQKSKTKD